MCLRCVPSFAPLEMIPSRTLEWTSNTSQSRPYTTDRNTHMPFVCTSHTTQDVDNTAFDRDSVFQVGYCDESNVLHILYIQAGDDRIRTDWQLHLRHVVEKTTKVKSPRFHTSVYQDKGWMCCKVTLCPSEQQLVLLSCFDSC